MLKRLNCDVDDELYREFKAYCARRGETIRDEVVGLIRAVVERDYWDEVCREIDTEQALEEWKSREIERINKEYGRIMKKLAEKAQEAKP